MIYVKDDFLKNPYDVRNYALKQEYITEGIYPGHRSFNVSEEVKDLILREAKNILKKQNIKCYAAFQYSTRDFKEGLFHTDISSYAAILFLTPNPPQNCGLELCEKCDIVIDDHLAKDKHEFYKNTKSIKNQIKFDRLRRKINNSFSPIAKIPNKFNRIVIFDSKMHHRAQKFFGDSIENSRLTIASFFFE